MRIALILIGLLLVSVSAEGQRVKFGLYLIGLLVMSLYVAHWDGSRLTMHWIPLSIDILVLLGLGAWLRERLFGPFVTRGEQQELHKRLDDVVKDDLHWD